MKQSDQGWSKKTVQDKSNYLLEIKRIGTYSHLMRSRNSFPSEAEKAIAIWGEQMWAAMFYLLVTTGIRLGEAQALTWKDWIPAAKKTILFSPTLQVSLSIERHACFISRRFYENARSKPKIVTLLCTVSGILRILSKLWILLAAYPLKQPHLRDGDQLIRWTGFGSPSHPGAAESRRGSHPCASPAGAS